MWREMTGWLAAILVTVVIIQAFATLGGAVAKKPHSDIEIHAGGGERGGKRAFDHDVSVDGFPDFGIVGPNTTFYIQVYVSNLGNNIENFTLNATIYFVNETESLGPFYDDQYVENLFPGEQRLVTFEGSGIKLIPPGYTGDVVDIAGNMSINVTSLLPTDENPSNNCSNTTVQIKALPDMALGTIISPTDMSYYALGENVSVTADIVNAGNMDEWNVSVMVTIYHYESSTKVTDVINTTIIPYLGPYQTTRKTLYVWHPLSPGNYYINVTVNETYSIDLNPDNNTGEASVTVAEVRHDLGAVGVWLNPEPQSNGYSGGENVTITLSIRNYGDTSEQDYPVYCSILDPDGAEEYSATSYGGMVQAGGTVSITFPTPWEVPTSPEGYYNISAWCNLNGDTNTSNDVFSRVVWVGQINNIAMNSISLDPPPQPTYAGGEGVNVTLIVYNPTLWDIDGVYGGCRIYSPTDIMVYEDEKSIGYVGANSFQAIPLDKVFHVPLTPTGKYTIEAYVNSTEDEDFSDNVMTMEFYVGNLTNLKLESIDLSPPKTVFNVGESIVVGARVSNTGTVDIANASAIAEITRKDTGDEVWNATVAFDIGIGESISLSFSKTFIVPEVGDYYLNVTLVYSEDMDPSDNALSTQISAIQGITDLAITALSPPDGTAVREGEIEFNMSVENRGYTIVGGALNVTTYKIEDSGQSVLNEGFENATIPPGWSVNTTTGVGQWSVSNITAHDGNYSLHYGESDGSGYSMGVRTMLLSQDLDMTDAVGGAITYYCMFDLEMSSDYLVPVVAVAGEIYELSEGYVTGSSGGTWLQYTIDISEYAGSTIQIGFKMRTSSSGDKSQYGGVYVDDLHVSRYTGPALTQGKYNIPTLGQGESYYVKWSENLTAALYVIKAELSVPNETHPEDNTLTSVLEVMSPTEHNSPPHAVISSPKSGYTTKVGVGVEFDGSGSYDLDGDPLTYEWRINGVVSSTNASFTHAFEEEGSYIVILKVSDPYGGSDNSTIVIFVEKGEENQTQTANYTYSTYTEGYVTLTLHHTDNTTPYVSISLHPISDVSLVEQAIEAMYQHYNMFFTVEIKPVWCWDFVGIVVNYSASSVLTNITDPAYYPALYTSDIGDLTTWEQVSNNTDADKHNIYSNLTKDGVEGRIFAVFTLIMPKPNLPPIVIVKASATEVESGERVYFIANASDPDGGYIVQIAWDVNGDNVPDGIGPNFNYTFYNNGKEPMVYNISISVVDDESSVNTSFIRITVLPKGVAGEKNKSKSKEDLGAYYATVGGAVVAGVIGLVLLILYLRKRRERGMWEEELEEEWEEAFGEERGGKGVGVGEGKEKEKPGKGKGEEPPRSKDKSELEGGLGRKGAKEMGRKGVTEKVPVRMSARREAEGKGLELSKSELEKLKK